MEITRRCGRCDADVAIDSTACPHCGADQRPLSPDRIRALQEQAMRSKANAEDEVNRLRKMQALKTIVVTTANDISDHRVLRTIGLAHGISVVSRGLLPRIGAHAQAELGGSVTVFEKQCGLNRATAYQRMIANAVELGANAVIAMRYDSADLSEDITEVLAYGTAVVVAPLDPDHSLTP